MNFSWIEEEERLANLNENSKRENLHTIELVSIYINQQNEIETVERETMDLSHPEKNILTQTELREWRDQRVKYTPNSKYILRDTLFFHVPIEPENIAEINPDTKTFLHHFSFKTPTLEGGLSDNGDTFSALEMRKGVTTYGTSTSSNLEDIPIPPAIFIFHSLTSLFFCFYETTNPTEPQILQSKLKTTQKRAKTVKITIPPSETIKTKKIRITRKRT
jgi:hypothetical protein